MRATGYWRSKIKAGVKFVARESIDPQNRQKFDKLSALIGEFRAKGDYSNAALKNSGIADYIFDTFGITVDINNLTSVGMDDNEPFAGVIPPDLDKNSVMLSTMQRGVATGRDYQQYKRFANDNKFLGYVDRKNAKVGGIFSKISNMMLISARLFSLDPDLDPDLIFTNDEIAGVICHEIGHVFTLFENLRDTVLTNVIALDATRQLMNARSDKEYVQVVEYVKKNTDLDISDAVEQAANGRSEDEAFIHVLTEVVRQKNNLVGSTAYANRTWERASDDFAQRLGAGAAGASALVKFHTITPMSWVHDRSYMSIPGHAAIEVAALVGTVLSFMGSPIIAAAITALRLAMAHPDERIYDRPEERFIAMRQQMVNELKEPQSDVLRERITKDISRIDAILKEVSDKRGMMELINEYIIPSARQARKNIQFHKELESFIYNDLFLAAAKMA